MFKKLKNIMLGIIAGANIMAIAVMLFFGYADHISPVNHPTLSSLSMLFPLAALVNLAFLFFWLTVKWRMAWIPFLGFLLAYSPMRVFFPVNLPSTPPAQAEVDDLNEGRLREAGAQKNRFGNKTRSERTGNSKKQTCSITGNHSAPSLSF